MDKGFFSSIFKGILRDLMWLISAFLIGTVAVGIVCLYYGVPLVFSIVGGLIVLGVALALKTDSIFD
jgi:phosphate/sulfate permease